MGASERGGNNFDLLRFAFSMGVFLVHAQALSAATALEIFPRFIAVDMMVRAFYVVSGYLVFMSYDKSRSLRDYFEKRARRILPAYFTVITLLVVGGAFLTTLPSSQYLSPATLKYYLANMAFLNFLAPDLPGVFESNRLAAVNGALWTLKVEVMFYVSVPLIAWGLRRFGKPAVLGFLYLASVGYYLAFEHLFVTTGRMLYFTLAQQFPGALAYFITGAALYYYGDRLGRMLPWAAAASVLFLQFSFSWVSTALQPMALGLLVIYLAVGFPYLGNFGKFGDLSYGLYIVHFPILQTLISLGVFARDPYLGLGTALLFATAAAFASWHLVEKPFLRRSSHYVVANTAG